MKFKKLFMVFLITAILNIALGVVATAEIDPHPWSIQPNSTLTLPK